MGNSVDPFGQVRLLLSVAVSTGEQWKALVQRLLDGAEPTRQDNPP